MYYQGPIIEDVAAAFTDPRAKKSPHLTPFLAAARGHLRNLVEQILVGELKDDEILDESSNGESGGEEVLEVTNEYAGAFGHYLSASPAAAASSTSPAAAAPSAHGASPSPVWRSKETKAEKFAEMAVAAWDEKPGIGVPFFGPKSSEFDLLKYYSSLDLGISKREGGEQATEAFKLAANSLHGFTATAAGPERIFSRAGTTVTALRNKLSVWTVQLMVFLYKNRSFMPSVEEVVAEILHRAHTKKAAKKAAHAASRDAAAASSPSSSSSASSEDAGGDVEFEGEDPDTDNLVLSESAVESILNDIASFRGSPADCDYGEDGTDDFLVFVDDLERCDRAADLFSLGVK